MELDHVSPTISARDFYTAYIAKRQPAIITGLPDDPTFCATQWTDLGYLAAKAGDTPVLVEPLHPASQQFGTDAPRVSLPFRAFLDSLQGEPESGPHHYLTTQYAEDEDGDAETLFSPPTHALRDDFPRVPRLMGNLVPQQVNLWLGKSRDGASSGLHHDFHDNLYCLLAGCKRFVLLPPASAHHLYPHGVPDALHANGLIAYTHAPLRADGLAPRAACAARVRALERRLAALPRGKGKGKGKDTARRALEEALDEAKDALAQEVLESGELEGEVDDFDALVGGLGSDGGSVGGGSVEGNDDGDEEEEEEGPLGGEDGEGQEEPPSFSRIPTALLHQHLGLPTTAALPEGASADAFPDLAKIAAPYVVELKAGEMLYLPASWWHEVTSRDAGSAGVHMAFNWWFYPPDAKEERFEEPYADELVWGYLREKASGKAEETSGKRKPAEEEARSGKRTKR